MPSLEGLKNDIIVTGGRRALAIAALLIGAGSSSSASPGARRAANPPPRAVCRLARAVLASMMPRSTTTWRFWTRVFHDVFADADRTAERTVDASTVVVRLSIAVITP